MPRTEPDIAFNECIKDLRIPYGSFGPTLEAYQKRFENADHSPANVERTMRTIQDRTADITFFGGQTVRPFLMGHRQIRKPSFDIDAVIHTPTGLESIVTQARSEGDHPFLLKDFGGGFIVKNGLPVSFVLGNVYGIQLERGKHTHIVRDLHMCTPEVVSSLKLRRKTNNGKPRGKDIADIASLICAKQSGKINFCLNSQESFATSIGSKSIRTYRRELEENQLLRGEEKAMVQSFFCN